MAPDTVQGTDFDAEIFELRMERSRVDLFGMLERLYGAFHGRWASIPRDRGLSFHFMVGSHSTRRWAADLTIGFMRSGLG